MVDAGNSLVKRGKIGRNRPELQRKADLIAEAWAIGGIDAVAFGENDWALGTDFVRNLVAEHELPLLAGNLTCGDTALDGATVVERGGMTVGFVGVTTGEVEGCEVGDAAQAVRADIDRVQAQQEVDLWVGLLPLKGEALTAVMTANPELTLVVDGASGRKQTTPRNTGGILVTGAGSRTKYLGVLRLELNDPAFSWTAQGGKEALEKEIQRLTDRLETAQTRATDAEDADRRERYQRQVTAYTSRMEAKQAELDAIEGGERSANTMADDTRELSDEVAEHDVTHAKVVALLEALESGATVSGSSINALARTAPEGSPYAGAEACRSCHTDSYAQWASTPHAHAWLTLVEEKRSMEADCWSCHSTGANQPGGPTFAAEVGGLHDVQCESCHGPAAEHAAMPATAVKPIRTPDEATCTACHDGEQDGGQFDLDTYWPRVVHGTE